MVKQITKNEFESAINSPNEVLVDFFATWCGPCRMLAPIMEEISEELNVFKVNVDDEEELAIKYGIMSIPCVICFKNGQETNRIIGFHSKEEILELIKQ